MTKAGLRYKNVASVWGKVSMPKQGYHCRACFYYQRQFSEQGMDESGVLAEALKRAVKLVTKVDFRETSELLTDLGLALTKSRLERLHAAYGKEAWVQAKAECEDLSPQPLSRQARAEQCRTEQPSARRFVIEADACFVLERDKADTGGLEGREVKSLIIYPLTQPSKRASLSSSVAIGEFRVLAQGFLRQAGIKQEDVCLGLGDGASWVRDLVTERGCKYGLLDVFHALSYLDKVLIALGYSEQERLAERKAWLRGEVDGALWLQTTQAHYNLTDTVSQSWDDKTLEAWAYLHNHAQQGALTSSQPNIY